MTSDVQPTHPEDLKIIKLARAARARTEAAYAACVRDTDGRTYAATNIGLPHLQLTAIQAAVAMAVSSGALGVEAVALIGEDGPSSEDLDLLGDLPGLDAVVWVADRFGVVSDVVHVSR